MLFTVIVLTLCAGVFYLIKPYLPRAFGTTTGNFMNGQWTAELDGEFYFFERYDDEEGLYKMDREGKVIKISNQKGINLNVVGDYLYFQKSNAVGEKDQIVKMKKDGSESQILFEGDIYLYLVVVDQKMYFGYKPDNEDRSSIYSMTTDGKNLKKTNLREDLTLQLLLNPKMNLKDMIFPYGSGYDGYSMQIKDNYCYLYKDSEGWDYPPYDLYHTKKKGTEGKFLADRVTAFNVAEDNYLYYAQLNEDVGSVTISKMNIETLKSEELMEIETNGEEVVRLNVAVDKIHIAIENTGVYFY